MESLQDMFSVPETVQMMNLYDHVYLKQLLYAKLTTLYKEEIFSSNFASRFLTVLITNMNTKRLVCLCVEHEKNLFSRQLSYHITNHMMIEMLLTRRPLTITCGHQTVHIVSSLLSIQCLTIIAETMFENNSFWKWLFDRIDDCCDDTVSGEQDILSRLVLCCRLTESRFVSPRHFLTSLMSITTTMKMEIETMNAIHAREKCYIGYMYENIVDPDKRALFFTNNEAYSTMAVIEYISHNPDINNTVLVKVQISLLALSTGGAVHRLVKSYDMLKLMNCSSCKFLEFDTSIYSEMNHISKPLHGQYHRIGINLNESLTARNIVTDNTSFRRSCPPISNNILSYLPNFKTQVTTLTDLQSLALKEIRNKMKYDIRRYLGVPILTKSNELFMIDRRSDRPMIYSEEENNACKVHSALLALNTGSGKTLVSLLSAMMYIFINQDKMAVLIIPDTLLNQWKSEVDKHTTWRINEHYIAVNNIKEITRYQKIFQTSSDSPRVCLASINAFRRPCFDILMKTLASKINGVDTWRGGMIIVDEAHKLNAKTGIFKKIIDHNFDFSLAITATSYQNISTVNRLLKLDNIKTGMFNNSRLLEMVEIFGKSEHASKGNIVQNAIFIEPNGWTRQAHELLANIHSKWTYELASRSRKIMRIYERICAGGAVDGELLLAVLTRLLSQHVHTSPSPILLRIDETSARSKAYAEPSDECQICLCAFDSPLQLNCGHVFCQECVKSVIELTRKRCPVCRVSLKVPLTVSRPSWTNRKRKNNEADIVNENKSNEKDIKYKVEAVIGHRREYQNMLVGLLSTSSSSSSSSSPSSHVVLNEKLIAFKKYILDYCENKTANSRLVIFSKRDVPCYAYMEVLLHHKLSVVRAGVLKTKRKESCENISKFQQGQVEVLLLNYKYCEGFDLVNASHTLICDFDISLSKLVQAAGRSKRIGQLHTNIYISTLVMKDSFDEFLYRQIGKGEGKLSKDNTQELEWITTRHMPGTVFYAVNECLTRIHAIKYTDILLFNRITIRIRLSQNILLEIYNGGKKFRINQYSISVERLLAMNNEQFSENDIVLKVRHALLS
jgi:superfamily II DNA or RNA helicase